jgi:hypothetical protein
VPYNNFSIGVSIVVSCSSSRSLTVLGFICEFCYVLNFTLIKTSILFFYLRVFPTRTFRLLCWTVMAFCVASGITFISTIFFQCQPISHVWNRDLKGTCINNRSIAYANGGINILQDILIVLLPLYEMRILQLSTREKVGVYAMFGLGLM